MANSTTPRLGLYKPTPGTGEPLNVVKINENWDKIDADDGGVSSWNDLTDKPSTFPPEGHTHSQADVTNLTADLAARPPILVLAPGAPVPVGTANGTIILRTA